MVKNHIANSNEKIQSEKRKKMPDLMKNAKPDTSKAAPAMSKKEAVKQHLEEMATAAAQVHIVAEGETLSHIALK